MHKIILFTFAVLLSAKATAFEILALGTSNTNCKGVERSKIFPAQLQELLRIEGINVQVVNAGVDGDKPVWMENRLRSSITDQTRLVIFEPGPNDRNKATNIDYSERILATLQTAKLTTIYVSHAWIQSNEEAEQIASKYGAYYYGHWNKDVPTDRVHRQFDTGSGGGHMTAEGCQLWARNMVPLITQVVKEQNIQ